MLHLRYDFESNEFCCTIGQRLRYYRQLKGYSTRQLAAMVSVAPATITLYENDKHPIKYKTAVSIAEVLKIDRTLLLDDYTTFVDYPCNKLLQGLREQLNLNQSEIATMIGVAPNSYSAWENASRIPRRQEYKNILPLLQKANITL
jgi:DNA-binding helix-turn-helix protein